MSTESTYSAASASADYSLRPYSFFSSVSWGAILAGWAAAVSFEVLFVFLGAGLGFAVYTPLTDANPASDLGAGAVIIQGISAVFSLWFGGWVAGRLTPSGSRSLGGLHGLLVWSASVVAGILFVASGASWVTGDLSKLAGGGLAMAGQPAAAVAGRGADLAKEGAKQSSDTLSSFTDEAMGGRASDNDKAAQVRAKRDTTLAVAKLFNPEQEARMQDNRAALIKVLQDEDGMSQAQAEKTVDEWITTYNDLKAQLKAAKDEAAAKARAAAEETARVLAILSLTAFVGFGLGAAAAAFGGKAGAKYAVKIAARPVATI